MSELQWVIKHQHPIRTLYLHGVTGFLCIRNFALPHLHHQQLHFSILHYNTSLISSSCRSVSKAIYPADGGMIPLPYKSLMMSLATTAYVLMKMSYFSIMNQIIHNVDSISITKKEHWPSSILWTHICGLEMLGQCQHRMSFPADKSLIAVLPRALRELSCTPSCSSLFQNIDTTSHITARLNIYIHLLSKTILLTLSKTIWLCRWFTYILHVILW